MTDFKALKITDIARTAVAYSTLLHEWPH